MCEKGLCLLTPGFRYRSYALRATRARAPGAPFLSQNHTQGWRSGWFLLLGLADRLSPDYRAEHFCRLEFLWRGASDVAVEDDNIRQHSWRECSLLFLFEFGKCRTGGVGGDGLVDGEFLIGEIIQLTVFAFTSDGSVEPAERSYGLN